MSKPLDFVSIARETTGDAIRIGASTWPWMLAYCAVAVLAVSYSSGGNVWTFLGMQGFVLIAACAWGAMMYRRLLDHPPEKIAGRTAKLFGATLLVYLLIGLVAFIVGLALAIVSGVLIAASGFDPSAGEAADVEGSIAALRASGAIWIIYLLGTCCISLLIWFSLRLYLYGVATVARGRVLVFQTWGLTEGHVLSIGLLCIGAVLLPLLAAGFASELTARQMDVPSRWSLPNTAIAGAAELAQPAIREIAIHGLLAVLYHIPAILLGHSLAAALFRHLGDNAVFE